MKTKEGQKRHVNFLGGETIKNLCLLTKCSNRICYLQYSDTLVESSTVWQINFIIMEKFMHVINIHTSIQVKENSAKVQANSESKFIEKRKQYKKYENTEISNARQAKHNSQI